MSNLSAKGQLQAFYISLTDQGYITPRIPRNWLEAFQSLSAYIKNENINTLIIGYLALLFISNLIPDLS